MIFGNSNFGKKITIRKWITESSTASAARMSEHFVLKSRMYLLVKNLPESDDGSFIQMSFISTDLEVKGITAQLFEQPRPLQKGQRQ